MVFNRALRIKHRDYTQGSKMFIFLIKQLDRMLGTPNTYYGASLYFELVRTATSLQDNALAIEYLERGRVILADHYGGPTGANYLDFLLRKIELYVNFVLDANDAKTKEREAATTIPGQTIEDIKRELAEANDAFIEVSKSVNVLNTEPASP